VQVAGDGGMGEDDVVEFGVLLEFWKISSSSCEFPGGEVATRARAGGGVTGGREEFSGGQRGHHGGLESL